MYIRVIFNEPKCTIKFMQDFFKLVGVKCKEKDTTIEYNGVQNFDVTAFIYDFGFDSLNFEKVDTQKQLNDWHRAFMNNETNLDFDEYCSEHTYYGFEFTKWSESTLRPAGKLLKKIKDTILSNGWSDLFLEVESYCYEGEEFCEDQWQVYKEELYAK